MGGDGREVEQPHDSFFKSLFAEPGVADALLRERLPPEVVATFSTAKPEMVPGVFIDPSLRWTQTDQLFKVRTKDGSPAYVYCLLEHKSWPDPRVAEQLLRYLTRIWSFIARKTPDLPLRCRRARRVAAKPPPERRHDATSSAKMTHGWRAPWSRSSADGEWRSLTYNI